MNKRNLMNLILAGGVGLPASYLAFGYAAFFVPPRCEQSSCSRDQRLRSTAIGVALGHGLHLAHHVAPWRRGQQFGPSGALIVIMFLIAALVVAALARPPRTPSATT